MMFESKNGQIINNSLFGSKQNNTVNHLGFILTLIDGRVSLYRIGEVQPLYYCFSTLSMSNLTANIFDYVALFDFSKHSGSVYSIDEQVKIANFLIEYSMHRALDKLMHGLKYEDNAVIQEAFQEMLCAD